MFWHWISENQIVDFLEYILPTQPHVIYWSTINHRLRTAFRPIIYDWCNSMRLQQASKSTSGPSFVTRSVHQHTEKILVTTFCLLTVLTMHRSCIRLQGKHSFITLTSSQDHPWKGSFCVLSQQYNTGGDCKQFRIRIYNKIHETMIRRRIEIPLSLMRDNNKTLWWGFHFSDEGKRGQRLSDNQIINIDSPVYDTKNTTSNLMEIFEKYRLIL